MKIFAAKWHFLLKDIRNLLEEKGGRAAHERSEHVCPESFLYNSRLKAEETSMYSLEERLGTDEEAAVSAQAGLMPPGRNAVYRMGAPGAWLLPGFFRLSRKVREPKTVIA